MFVAASLWEMQIISNIFEEDHTTVECYFNGMYVRIEANKHINVLLKKHVEIFILNYSSSHPSFLDIVSTFWHIRSHLSSEACPRSF